MGLDKLLYLRGVGAEFVDCDGQLTAIHTNDRLAILQAMLAKPEIDNAIIDQQIEQLDVQPWRDFLAPFQYCFVDQAAVVLHLAEHDNRPMTITVRSAASERTSARQMQWPIDTTKLVEIGDYQTEQQRYIRYRYPLSTQIAQLTDIGIGYLQLELHIAGSQVAQGELLLAPRHTFDALYGQSQAEGRAKRPAKLSHKPWGVSVHLPSLRSDTQWGMGDLADLQGLLATLAARQCDFVVINPLHALALDKPSELSPYSPIDRRFIHPLYISIEQVPECRYVADSLTLTYQSSRNELNQSPTIEAQAVSRLKLAALYLIYQSFVQYELSVNSARAQAFELFIERGGKSLQAYIDHQADSVAAIAGENAEQFIAFMQFEVTRQLTQTQALATELGMAIGLVGDLAVGTVADGVEAAQHPQLFCAAASIGAPPDRFAARGQNWGLVPMQPWALKATGFGHFRELLASNMQHYGALRIDHIMGLLRLWWWTAQNANDPSGAYVYYDADALFAILAYESHAANCTVIGEDLGIVPDEIRTKLQQFNIYSNQLFYFTRQYDRIVSPELHQGHSLMMLANHDVPPLAAWWLSDDLHLQHSLGLITTLQLEAAEVSRDCDIQQLVKRWRSLGLLSDVSETVAFEAILPAWLSDSASSAAELFSVQLCDLLSETVSNNIPGTSTEYPNWRRRYSMTVSEISRSPLIDKLLSKIAQQRNAGASANDVSAPRGNSQSA